MTVEAYPRRLIEVDLPIKEISAHSRREKSIRQGHISTLHIWWARRPLAACRSVISAALWLDPADDKCPSEYRLAAADVMAKFAAEVRSDRQLAELCAKHWNRWNGISADTFHGGTRKSLVELRAALLDFISDFANWDASNSRPFLQAATALTAASAAAVSGNGRPVVYDPFAGGGSMPLEALRLGAEAFATDLNPVPVLLNRVLLEYIPKSGPALAGDVRTWGEWLAVEAEKRIGHLYSAKGGGSPIVFLWARTVRCEGPGCGLRIPLFRTAQICQKPGKLVAVTLGKDKKNGRFDIGIVEGAEAKKLKSGTSKGGAATCPDCGYTTAVERVRAQLHSRRGGTRDAQLLAVVETGPGGRSYRAATVSDVQAARSAEAVVESLAKGDLPFGVPDEELNHLRGFFNVVLYGMTTWGDLFAPRQLATLLTFWKLLRDDLPAALAKEHSPDQVKAIVTAVACVLGRATNGWSAVSRWHSKGEKVEGTFARQALPMVWDFAEANPFSGSTGNFRGAVEWVADVCETVSAGVGTNSGRAQDASATNQPLPDDSVDLVATDPPYYDAVPYADLSDYFYVWLKRGLGSIQPDLFKGVTTPKSEECVMLAHRAAMYREKDAGFFERQMALAVGESRRVTKPAGVGVFVFANKSTDGWEAMLSALVRSGWVVTASWPIDTEMSERLRARGSAVLGSSVHLVCRPRENADGSSDEAIGTWRTVLAELPIRIHEWMPRLAKEGVVGADAIFACLGPALEVFSRYSRVEKASGEQVTLKEYLEQVWAAVAKEALSLMFEGADASELEEDARLTAMWLWTINAGASGGASPSAEDEDGDADESGPSDGKSSGFSLEYDAARKIAQGLGAHLEKLESVVQLRGETATLLAVADRAKSLFAPTDTAESNRSARARAGRKQLGLFAELEAAETSGSLDVSIPRSGSTTLDRLHQAMILFAAGRAEAMKRFIQEDGVGTDTRFWRLAQSLSALYPAGTDEKRWVDGVLARKKSLGF